MFMGLQLLILHQKKFVRDQLVFLETILFLPEGIPLLLGLGILGMERLVLVKTIHMYTILLELIHSF